jgi:hypothetical protein
MAKPLAPKTRGQFLPKEIGQLRSDIEQLPRSVRDRLLPLCDKICHFLSLQGRLFELAQEAVDRLQLEVKCVHFDLECTRRERDEFREQLEHFTEDW